MTNFWLNNFSWFLLGVLATVIFVELMEFTDEIRELKVERESERKRIKIYDVKDNADQ